MERLHMNEIREIIYQLRQGEGVREIARSLSLSRNTVRKYRDVAEEHGLLYMDKPLPDLKTLGTLFTPPLRPRHMRSTVEPFGEVVGELLEAGVEMMAIWQRLRDEHGYKGSYTSVRRYVVRIRPGTPEAVCRVETAPGEEAQVGKLQPILSQLHKQFEATVLAPKGQRDSVRLGLLTTVNSMVEEAEKGGFDIDGISEEDLQIPHFPEPSFNPSDMDMLLRDEHLIPPGVECQELDPSTYAMRIPGHMEKARVTTSPRIFDEHFESHQLFLPEGPLFCDLAKDVDSGEEAMDLSKVNRLADILEL